MLDQWRNSGYRLVLGVPILPGRLGRNAGRRVPRVPTTSTSPSWPRPWSKTAPPTPSCGSGGSSTAPGTRGASPATPTPRTSPSSGARSSTPCGPCRASSSSSCGTPTGAARRAGTSSSPIPGSAYVDYIGTDVYDEYWGSSFTPQASWSNAVTQTWGLNWLTTFAAAQGRPIAIPEWSVDYRSDGHGLGRRSLLHQPVRQLDRRPTTWRSRASSRSTTPPAARTTTSPTAASRNAPRPRSDADFG